MKKSKILELVTDGKCYADDFNMLDNENYKKYSEELEEIFEVFCKGMNKEKKFELMKKFDTAQCNIETAVADEYFKQGFKLGLILGAQNFLD